MTQDLPPINASVDIRDEDDTLLPARPPRTYLGMAEAHLNGVSALAIAGPPASLTLALVAGFVAECALKAYLSRDGDDERVKKKDIRHNLEALWDLALAEGLPIPEQPPSWFTKLSGLHKGQEYYSRYGKVHAISTPPPEPMVSDLAKLVQLVAKHL